MGTCSISQGELWAIAKGVEIAWSRGFTNHTVESDSKFAISMLDGGCEEANFSKWVTFRNIFPKWVCFYVEHMQLAGAISEFGDEVTAGTSLASDVSAFR